MTACNSLGMAFDSQLAEIASERPTESPPCVENPNKGPKNVAKIDCKTNQGQERVRLWFLGEEKPLASPREEEDWDRLRDRDALAADIDELVKTSK